MAELSSRREVGFAAFVTLLSAALFGGALLYPPQSSQFPRFLMALQLLFSIALLVRAWRRRGAGARGTAGPVSLGVPLQVFVATAAYVIAIEQLGYFVASALFLFGAMYWFGRHRLIVMIGVTAGFLAVMYALFILFIGVRLPEGLLF